ncbi:phosphatidylglycerophosphatase A family protein [Gracilimonas amylolytica]|uniref:phosphatidylglycerophosphatase A family protein n=1 Tax=Gracilimonas amylolytica TaxID=1749045 RepID=UPI001E48EB3D|nr:phosphatidylglycerophosphatase A [Gracilimonas amylolytica]
MVNKLKLLLGTGFYSGLLPKAPGTFGSLAALILIYPILQEQDLTYLIMFTVLSSLISLWVSPFFEQTYAEDPGQLVADEWAGQSLVFLTIPLSGSLNGDMTILLAGFMLFRFFDIVKPLGIHSIQKYKGGIGILADDLLAGLYALICLKTLIFFWPKIFGIV